MNQVSITPAKWVRAVLLEAMIGISVEAIRKKRQNGVWLEGKHFVKAPDGMWVYDWAEIDRWQEGLS